MKFNIELFLIFRIQAKTNDSFIMLLKMTQNLVDKPYQQSRTTNIRHRSITKQVVIGSFRIGNKIGRGAYGTVYQAFKIPSNEKFAVKIISFDDSTYESVKYEADICKKLSHQNIAKVQEVIETREKMYIFMEYCENGQLFEYIKSKGPMSQEMAGRIFIQLYSAIKYLHLKKIAHRDIKTQNILLDAQMNPKLIDFGLSKQYDSSNQMMQTFCGSPSYVAPEIIKRQKYNGEKIDIWSLGVTLYIMLQAAQPFFSKTNTQTKIKIANFQWSTPINSSSEARQLYEKIFVAAPSRINLSNIQNSQFFQKYGWKKVRIESRSTQKTQRLSTGDAFDFALPQITNNRQKSINKSSVKIVHKTPNNESNEQVLYNSILLGQKSTAKIHKKGNSTQLKNLKIDYRIKCAPISNSKHFLQAQNLAWFKREVISNMNHY